MLFIIGHFQIACCYRMRKACHPNCDASREIDGKRCQVRHRHWNATQSERERQNIYFNSIWHRVHLTTNGMFMVHGQCQLCVRCTTRTARIQFMIYITQTHTSRRVDAYHISMYDTYNGVHIHEQSLSSMGRPKPSCEPQLIRGVPAYRNAKWTKRKSKTNLHLTHRRLAEMNFILFNSIWTFWRGAYGCCCCCCCCRSPIVRQHWTSSEWELSCCPNNKSVNGIRRHQMEMAIDIQPMPLSYNIIWLIKKFFILIIGKCSGC